MAISKSLILVITGGAPILSFGGVYVCSLQKLKDFLRNELLGYDESHNEDWKVLQASLNQNINYTHLQVTGLDQIQDKENKEPVAIENLKKWCKNAADINVSADKNLNTHWQNAMIDAASKFCILTIEKKLKDPINLGSQEEQQFLQANLSKLQLHDPEETLNNELKQVKEMKQTEEALKGLKDWCGTMYTKGYNNPKDIDWLLAQKYCQKNN